MKPIYLTMITSLIVNAILIVLKVVAGIIINSKTLIADSVHSLSDFSTDIISIIGQKASSKEADNHHPFGHGKIEYITSLIIGFIIMMLGLGLIYNSINSKISIIDNNNIIIGVVMLIIISKYCLSKYIIRKAQKYKSNILMSSAKESMADVLTSIGVLLTLIIYDLTVYYPVFKYIDKLGCIIISLFIIKTSYYILKENMIAILGEREQDELIINKVKTIILKVEGVIEIDNLILMKYGSYYNASIKIAVDANKSLTKSHDIAHEVEEQLIKNDCSIKYVIVHINPFTKKILE